MPPRPGLGGKCRGGNGGVGSLDATHVLPLAPTKKEKKGKPKLLMDVNVLD